MLTPLESCIGAPMFCLTEKEEAMNEINKLRDERDRLYELCRRAIHALRATDAELDPMVLTHRRRIDLNALIIEEWDDAEHAAFRDSKER